MADFTTLKLQGNTGASDAAPTWTDVLFGTANNELRAALSSGSQTGATSSANWPSMLRPASGVQLIDNMYQFTADTTGNKITTYDGTGAHYNQFRISWDALGTFAAAPIISAWKDNTLPAASPGTQPSVLTGGDGSSIINGQTTDTNNTSYLKAVPYGVGVTAAGAADNPSSSIGTNPAATSGAAGAQSPAAGSWGAWQSLQAATQYIQNSVTPKATTAGTWNLLMALYMGANITGGTLLPVLGLQYQWI